MRADSKIDKDTYPYGTVGTGNGYKVVHIPNMTEMAKVELPNAVATVACKQLNEAHWAHQLRNPIKAVLTNALHVCHSAHSITDDVYVSTLAKVEALK